ncbi:MAG: ABC transporter permease [Acidobacteriota bacterium]|nr:ABC transporter permease [Blastocatellia bacterium]MDW8412174.1 ABC transporter permease [Acidobacteriota bacterium]
MITISRITVQPMRITTRYRLLESGRMALQTLSANKLRAMLTTLGIVVGVATVIAMVSIIQGLNLAFTEQIESLGSNTIFVTKFDPGLRRTRTDEERQRKDLTVEDGLAIAESDAVMSVSPEYRLQTVTIRYLERQTDTMQLTGATTGYELTRSNYVAEGRFFTEYEIEHRANVCVLSADVVEALFPFSDPIDKSISIDGRKYRVIGILERMGNFFGQSRDVQVFIPITTFQKYYPTDGSRPDIFFAIIVRPRSRAHVQKAVDDITSILRRRRGLQPGQKNNFGIATQDSLLDLYNQLTGATALVLTVVSSISLFIGGIGVMNIMLVSVVERTREIGIRKAIGARSSDILWQFLIEAVTLTGCGGLLGTSLGYGVSFAVNRFSPLPSFVPLWAIAAGLSVSFAVGLFFGIYPARRAAALDPVEALRYE